MSDDKTVCARCKYVYVVNKSDHWSKWLCMEVPMPQKFNPVTGDTVADPPYGLARYHNDGSCVMFKAGCNSLNPKTNEAA